MLRFSITCRSVISSVTALGARSGPRYSRTPWPRKLVSRTVAGTVLMNRRSFLRERVPVDEGLAPAGALELLGDAVARRLAEQHHRQLDVRAARAAREPFPRQDAAVLQVHDRLERGPDLAVLDDLEQPLALVALANPHAHQRAGDGVVHQPQDLALRALERAPQHDAVAADQHRPLLEVRQRQPAHARVQVLLDARRPACAASPSGRACRRGAGRTGTAGSGRPRARRA